MPLRYSNQFKEKYQKLSPDLRSKVDKALRYLDEDFRHPGLHSHPVQGYPGVFEAYVDQKYCLTYEREGNILKIRNVDNHDDCLRNP